MHNNVLGMLKRWDLYSHVEVGDFVKHKISREVFQIIRIDYSPYTDSKLFYLHDGYCADWDTMREFVYFEWPKIKQMLLDKR